MNLVIVNKLDREDLLMEFVVNNYIPKNVNESDNFLWIVWIFLF